MRSFRNSGGSVLIFTLWVLTFLTVIAVSIAGGVRQKILVMKRIEERQRILNIQQAGVRHACALIRQVMNTSNGQYSVDVKQPLHHEEKFLNHIGLGEDYVAVVIPDGQYGQGERFGVVDEESKINLNYVSEDVLKKLIEQLLPIKPDEVRRLTSALVDWRQQGSSELVGFLSDEYYRNLRYPYPKKDSRYESIEELLLVRGVSQEHWNQLRKVLTVWGDGQVNINTASAVVLSAVGLSVDTVANILEARRGKDGIDATSDDHVFIRTFDIGIELTTLLPMKAAQLKEIDILNAQGLLTTNSYYFTIETRGSLAHGKSVPLARAVYGFRENKLLSWREK